MLCSARPTRTHATATTIAARAMSEASSQQLAANAREVAVAGTLAGDDLVLVLIKRQKDRERVEAALSEFF